MPDFPDELVEAAAKALAMDESSLVFTDGYGGFDFDHGGAAHTVLSVVGPLIQRARDADGQRLYSLLALFDTRDGSPLADLVQHAREGWERSHPDMGEDDAWQAFDSLWSRFTESERDWRCECGDLNRWHESCCYRCGAGRTEEEVPDA